ncbi:hypothetical protein Nepgr_032411 [Nepenthes gracilis]|uniref:Glucan endo-1,3-beta-D-glucosidase n=1 Tax=Nepenthes gracilis TaxID=150966 RepID=A0AAD3Y610_NEPGR|nr:hypothetical protein Nepgr_032411 [Nepenthes gracilis]
MAEQRHSEIYSAKTNDLRFYFLSKSKNVMSISSENSLKPVNFPPTHRNRFLFFIVLSCTMSSLCPLTVTVTATADVSLSEIGVTYSPGTTLDHLPPPEQVASALQRLKISSVHLPDSDPSAVRAFSYSNISLFLTVPNRDIPSIAANRSNALAWLHHHVVPFYPRAHISAIAVGSDVLNAKYELSNYLLPAIRNVDIALHKLGIYRIAVSTTFSFSNVLATAFPPSSAKFLEPANKLVIKPLLQFLKETNSSFFVNLYPYHIYKLNPGIPIGFALFQENPFNFRDDFTTGVRYRNLFDTMVDAVITALTVAGHENIPVVVAETGWPGFAVKAEADANQVYAEMYLRGLIRHLRSGNGTPLRKGGVAQTYIYELFDRQGNRLRSLQQWGILYSNLTRKYINVDFGSSSRIEVSKHLLWMALGFHLFVAVLLWDV